MFTSSYTKVVAFDETVTYLVAATFTTLSFVFGWHIARCAGKGDERFIAVRQSSLSIIALGGTTFEGADLTDADLSDASFKSTSFTDATLTRTNFTGATQLDKAKPGNTYLAHLPLLTLLTDPSSGYEIDLSGQNLRGVYLANANLEAANFTNTDLADADLTNANLKDTNFREANCIGTNFTRAYLTGACLEAWNIDLNTVFEDVDCQYVFLRKTANTNGSRERRPHDPDTTFNPGDFEKLFSEATNLVEILIRDGLDPEAFSATFQDLIDKFGVTPADVRSIEKKGNDVLVTVEVPNDTEKADFERTALRSYEDKLAKLTAERDAARLEAGKQEQRAETLQSSLLQIATNLSSNSPNVHIDTRSIAMSQNDGRKIEMGDGSSYTENNVSGNAQQAGRDIVNNNAAAGMTKDDVLELLTFIETAIQTRADLPEDLKQRSMRYLGAATEEAKEAKPDKALMAGNLKKVGSTIAEAGSTVKSAKAFATEVAPTMMKLGTWLGTALL